jgi:hypothetical protein
MSGAPLLVDTTRSRMGTLSNPRMCVPGHAHQCGCTDCDASRRHYRAWYLLRVAESGGRTVPVGPTRRAIQRHLDAGWSYAHIAHLTALTHEAVYHLVRYASRVHTEHAEALQTVRPTFDNAPDHTLVPAHGVHRRIQALHSIGWTRHQMQPHLSTRLSAMLTQDRVRPATWRQVAAMYDLLHMTPGPSAESRKRAARAGWVPPLAWDDIDDVTERPKR